MSQAWFYTATYLWRKMRWKMLALKAGILSQNYPENRNAVLYLESFPVGHFGPYCRKFRQFEPTKPVPKCPGSKVS